MEKFKVAIIGGYGGMGQIFTRLFKEEGLEVVITGPTQAKGEKAAEEIGVEYILDNAMAVKDADIVVVTVPIDKTIAIIKEIGPHIKSGALFMDLTSVKEEPCKAMAEFSNKNVEVIGTHPIFGPRVPDISGQVIVITPVRGKKWISWLKNLLEKHKARVFESTPEEHDKTMAVVQGLTHFAYISIGKTLDKLDFDIKKSKNFSSPIYELMLDMIGRIIGQDPKLYAEIQMENPNVKDIRDIFLETANELNKIVKERNEKEFIKIMAESAKHFGDVERAMGRSDKAIASLVSELEKLNSLIGKEVCLQHIYSGQRHLGIIESVTPEEVTLNDSGKLFSLKLSNVQILPNRERINFKIQKFGTTTRDFSVILDSNADENFLAELIKEHDENIVSTKIKDVYKSQKLGDDKKSVCFGIEMINNNVKAIELKAKEFFEKISGKLR